MQDWTTTMPAREEASAMAELGRDPASRKRFLKMMGGAGAATAFATFLAACGGDSGSGGQSSAGGGGPGAGDSPARPAGGAAATREENPDPRDGTTDLDIVKYALKLEQLEAAFYVGVVDSGLFRGAELDMIERFGEQEREHRETLESTVEMLGGDIPSAPRTKFPLESATSVLSLAAELENAGAAAYLGQANRIRDKELLAAALSIHSVEARHAAALNALAGLPPEPQGSFAVPAPMEAVLTSVQRFIVS